MKKKIFFVFAVAAFAGVLAFNSITNSKQATVSTVTLSNIEALTKSELCPNGCCPGNDYCYCNGVHDDAREAPPGATHC